MGHLGTLDPFATGLLVIGVNKGTKFLTYLDDSKKTYVAKLHLGKKTSTGDIDGETLEEKEVPNFSQKEIEEVFSSFLGEGEQIPPMTSAIKSMVFLFIRKPIKELKWRENHVKCLSILLNSSL